MFTEENPRRLAQIALVVLLIIGCVAVLLPMIGAILFAFVLWICTWGIYSERLLPRLGGRNTLGASLMTLLLVLIILLPMIFLVGSLVNSADALFEQFRPQIEQGLPAEPPKILGQMPHNKLIDFLQLRPGQLADLRLETDFRDQLPEFFVFPNGGQRAFYVLKNGSARISSGCRIRFHCGGDMCHAFLNNGGQKPGFISEVPEYQAFRHPCFLGDLARGTAVVPLFTEYLKRRLEDNFFVCHINSE